MPASSYDWLVLPLLALCSPSPRGTRALEMRRCHCTTGCCERLGGGRRQRREAGQRADARGVGALGVPVRLARAELGDGGFEQQRCVSQPRVTQKGGQPTQTDDALADTRVVVEVTAQRLGCVVDVDYRHALQSKYTLGLVERPRRALTGADVVACAPQVRRVQAD